MKKIIYIVFFTSLNLFSQEIVRPVTSYYSADSIKNRTDLSRALADAVKKWTDSSFKAMEVDIYQPTLKFNFPDALKNKYKDSIVRVKVLAIGKESIKNKWHHYLLLVDNFNNPVKTAIDSTLLNIINIKGTNFIKSKNLLLTIRYSYLNGYELAEKRVVGVPFQILWYEFPENRQPKSGVYVQVFANSPNAYYRRMWKNGDRIPQWSEMISDNAGNPYDGIWRHSQTFKPSQIGFESKKGDTYNYQIKLISLIDKAEYISPAMQLTIE